MSIRAAVASNDGKVINQHFGHAKQFLIFDIDKNGNNKFIEIRKNIPLCSGGNHTLDGFKNTLDILKNIHIVLVSQIGHGASQNLLSNGIQPFIMPIFIDEALEKIGNKIVELNKKDRL
ncbi:MAG: NifB/NifX family molybdenum-iron cluster-binding protein [Methanobacterium sp.]|nr:NifB/NifX family molybdenum-iron cluster-binding protein [Methanobacterium sp.]